MNDSLSSVGWELEIGGLRLPISEAAIVLGRDPACDLPIPDERVSWQHLRLELRDGIPLITDLGSSNGTYLDGVRIDHEPQSIAREAIIQLGSTRARVREREPQPTTGSGRFRRVPVREHA